MKMLRAKVMKKFDHNQVKVAVAIIDGKLKQFNYQFDDMLKIISDEMKVARGTTRAELLKFIRAVNDMKNAQSRITSTAEVIRRRVEQIEKSSRKK